MVRLNADLTSAIRVSFSNKPVNGQRAVHKIFPGGNPVLLNLKHLFELYLLFNDENRDFLLYNVIKYFVLCISGEQQLQVHSSAIIIVKKSQESVF